MMEYFQRMNHGIHLNTKSHGDIQRRLRPGTVTITALLLLPEKCTLRQIINGKRLSALPFDDRNEALAERIAEKVASRLRRVEKKKAA